MSAPHRLLIALGVLLLTGIAAHGEPLFTLTDDGTAFLYRARPGDLPVVVAEMFGLAPRDVPALLAANNIPDATRVGPGFVYRIPNAAARALAERITVLEQDNARLGRELGEATDRGRAAARNAEEAQAAATLAEARASRGARLQALWPVAEVALVLLALAAGAAGAIAATNVRRQRRAERYARSLALELEEKRRIGLAERQESGRRILDLETKVRDLEARLGPRLLVGGRS
jgi:hypothetical protein